MAMNPGMKMLMMDKVRERERYPRSEYGGDSERRMIGYDRNRDYPQRRYEPESKRRRDSRGRYMMNDNYDDDEEDMRSQTWYPPHMMAGGSRYGFGDVYAHINAPGAMNRPGMMQSDESAPVDEHTARMWVQKMDGGEHFNMQVAHQHRAICPDCDPMEWYVAMNMMYSDYCETAKKMGMDKPEFYAHMAKDFLMDKDAKPHKLRRYMDTVPK